MKAKSKKEIMRPTREKIRLGAGMAALSGFVLLILGAAPFCLLASLVCFAMLFGGMQIEAVTEIFGQMLYVWSAICLAFAIREFIRAVLKEHTN